MSQRDEDVGFWQTEASTQDKVKGSTQVRGGQSATGVGRQRAGMGERTRALGERLTGRK